MTAKEKGQVFDNALYEAYGNATILLGAEARMLMEHLEVDIPLDIRRTYHVDTLRKLYSAEKIGVKNENPT